MYFLSSFFLLCTPFTSIAHLSFSVDDLPPVYYFVQMFLNYQQSSQSPTYFLLMSPKVLYFQIQWWTDHIHRSHTTGDRGRIPQGIPRIVSCCRRVDMYGTSPPAVCAMVANSRLVYSMILSSHAHSYFLPR